MKSRNNPTGFNALCLLDDNDNSGGDTPPEEFKRSDKNKQKSPSVKVSIKEYGSAKDSS